MFRRRKVRSIKPTEGSVTGGCNDVEPERERMMKMERRSTKDVFRGAKTVLRSRSRRLISGMIKHPTDPYVANGISNFVLATGALLFSLGVVVRNNSIASSHAPMRPSYDKFKGVSVMMPYDYRPNAVPFVPLPSAFFEEDLEPDYGGLEFWSLDEFPIYTRRIDHLWEYHEARNRESELYEMDDPHLLVLYEPDADVEEIGMGCQRNNWKNRKYPVCNSIHELTVERLPSFTQQFEIQFLGNGHYRNAWLMNPPDHMEFVYKRMKMDFGMDYWDMYKIQKEAIIMERLSASPRIISIYGYCSTTILAEAMESEVWRDIIPGTGRISQEELDELDDVYSQNDFSSQEKLDMSIEMAEALADLHGFEGGVILHGDTHPEQWLRSKDGRLVLNDFNNAEILDYATALGTYCKQYRDYGGFYRAPEEYTGDYIDEGVDTFSWGNNVYCLITGLWPFYPWNSYDLIQTKLLHGERAFVDPRWKKKGLIETRLVEIMERAWEHNPSDRVPIFEAIDFLKEVRNQVHARHR